MKKSYIFIIIIALLFIWFAVILSNPLRRSEQHIRKELLSETPLGTQFSEVRQFIHEKGWKTIYIDEDKGFYDQRVKPYKVVGEKSIRVSMGDYQGLPWRANVTVFWGFDKDSRLIDIWVWKSWDAL